MRYYVTYKNGFYNQKIIPKITLPEYKDFKDKRLSFDCTIQSACFIHQFVGKVSQKKKQKRDFSGFP